jgi:hypothetical protein
LTALHCMLKYGVSSTVLEKSEVLAFKSIFFL